MHTISAHNALTRRAMLKYGLYGSVAAAAPVGLWIPGCSNSPSPLRALPEKEHPYLFLNRKEVETIRTLAQKKGSEQHEHLEWLKGQAGQWSNLESPDLKARPETGYRVRDLGILYAVTQEQDYARQAARILLHQADEYHQYPVDNYAKVGNSSLEQSHWLVAASAGYDLIYDSGALGQKEKQHIEEDLLRPAAWFLLIGPGDEGVHRVGGGICNYRLVEDAGAAAVGFLLRDRELINMALDSPRGFYRHLEEGVLDDGGWWEDSPAYHTGMVAHFTIIAEAAWHAGLNLYDHPKYRLMFQWSNHLLLPDGTLPSTNDSSYGRTLSYTGMERTALLYYARTGDPSLEPLLARAAFGPIAQNDRGWMDVYTLWINTKIPDLKLRRRCVNLPASGKAILRTDSPAEKIDLIVDYGPHAGYHGHYDKCNIILYANGRMQAPDPGIGSYGHPTAHRWYRTTLAHNTVVANQRNQPPSTGYLHQFVVTPRFKMADISPVAERDENWGDQQQRRVVALVDEAFVIDIYRYGWVAFWAERGPRDWVYHNFGSFHTDEKLKPQEGPLGGAHGYEYVKNVRRGQAAGPTWNGTFSEGSQGVKLTMLNFPGLEIIAGDGPGVGGQIHNQPGTMPLVIARANADGPVTWKSVIEPFQGKPSITSLRQLPVQRPEGNVMDEEGLCLEIARDGALHHFLLGYTWGNRSFGDIAFDGQGAYLKYDATADPARQMPAYVFLALGSHLERGAFHLRTDRLASLYLQRLDDGSYLVENTGKDPVSASLVGTRWTNLRIKPVGAKGVPRGRKATRTKDTLTLTLTPGVRYILSR